MFAVALALLVDFAVLARGAHDLWAATVVYIAFLGLGTAVCVKSAWSDASRGVPAEFAVPLIGVAAAMAVSFGHAVNPSESFLGLMDWLTALAAFWIALSVFRSERAVATFLAGVVPVFWAETLLHAYQRATIAVSVLEPSGARHDAPQALTFLVTQSWGTMVNANLAAAFTIAWIPVLADRALRKRRSDDLPRMYWISGAAAAGLCFAFTCSAWGWICLLLGLSLLLTDERARNWLEPRRRAIGALAAAALAGGAALVWWKLFHKRDWAGNAHRAGENFSRVLWWASGWKMFRANPLWGVGIGNYGSAYLAYKVGHGQNSLFAHSLPVSLAAETGLLGCAALSFLFARWLRNVARDWDEIRDRRPFLAGLAMLLAFSAISLSMEYLANLLACALFLGIAAAPTVRTFWKPRRSAAVVLGAASLAACAYLLAPFLAGRNCVGAEELLKLGRAQDAIEGFSSAAAIDPLSSAAQRGWARALHARSLSARDPRDLEQAVVHMRRAAELDRLNAALAAELADYRREEETTSSRRR